MTIATTPMIAPFLLTKKTLKIAFSGRSLERKTLNAQASSLDVVNQRHEQVSSTAAQRRFHVANAMPSRRDNKSRSWACWTYGGRPMLTQTCFSMGTPNARMLDLCAGMRPINVGKCA